MLKQDRSHDTGGARRRAIAANIEKPLPLGRRKRSRRPKRRERVPSAHLPSPYEHQVARQEVAPIPARRGHGGMGVARASSGLDPQPFWMSTKLTWHPKPSYPEVRLRAASGYKADPEICLLCVSLYGRYIVSWYALLFARHEVPDTKDAVYTSLRRGFQTSILRSRRFPTEVIWSLKSDVSREDLTDRSRYPDTVIGGQSHHNTGESSQHGRTERYYMLSVEPSTSAR